MRAKSSDYSSDPLTGMMEEGYQEEGEAAGKWRRACLTSTQLSTYYVGNLEVNGLRKAYEAKNGPIQYWKRGGRLKVHR